jgi:hypothetical protein
MGGSGRGRARQSEPAAYRAGRRRGTRPGFGVLGGTVPDTRIASRGTIVPGAGGAHLAPAPGPEVKRAAEEKLPGRPSHSGRAYASIRIP